MKTKLWLLAATFFFTALSAHADAPCYQGQLKLSLRGGFVLLNYTIKDNQLTARVANPEDILDTGTVQKKVKDAFDPGPAVNLVPTTGARCPTCAGLSSESGKFTFYRELLNDGSSRTIIDYFGVPTTIVSTYVCPIAAPAVQPSSRTEQDGHGTTR